MKFYLYSLEIKEFTIEKDDKFIIIASDGVWEFIENIDVVRIVAPYYIEKNVEGACDMLMNLSLKSWEKVSKLAFLIIFRKKILLLMTSH